MNKTIGYILSVVGIIGFALTYDPINKALGNIIPSSLIITATIISIALLVIGIIIVAKAGKGEKVHEVPIYHGKNVVGFRRIKQ